MGRWVIAFLLAASPVLAGELEDKQLELRTTDSELKVIETERSEQSANLQQLKQEETRLISTADLLRGASGRHKQEGDQWDRDSAAYKEKDQAYDARWASLNARITTYNASCPAGTVPKEVYERCHPEWQALQGPTQARNAERTALEAEQKSLSERAKTWNQMQAGLRARWKDLSDATLANAAKQKAVNARLNELDQKAAALGAAKLRLVAQIRELSEECQRLLSGRGTTLEALKLKCGNVQFDNADPNLPPLGGQPKTGTTITPNR